MKTKTLITKILITATAGLLIPLIILSLQAMQAYAVPLPQGIDGTIYDLDGLTKASNARFSIQNHNTGQTLSGITKTGYYSVAINGNEGDMITITAWNIEHNTTRTITLNGVMHNVDLLLNMSLKSYSPQITSKPPVLATQNQPYRYQVEALDPNNDLLTYTLLQAPATMAISQTGLISWVPSNDDALSGQAQIIIAVNDTASSTVQKYTLNILNVNDAPVITSLPKTEAHTNELYTYEITAFDPDGDKLHYSLVSAPGRMTLNSSINSSTIRWVPGSSDAGRHTVSISVSDGNLSSQQTFYILVNSTNRKPEITSQPATTAKEDQQYIYVIQAADPDNDTIMFALLQSPPGMELALIEGQTALKWLPENKDVGLHKVQISASDGISSTTQEYGLYVENVNDAPVIVSNPKTTAIQGGQYRYPVQAADEDRNNLSYYLAQKPEGMEITQEGLITWTPKNRKQAYVSLVVSDTIAISMQGFNITVLKKEKKNDKGDKEENDKEEKAEGSDEHKPKAKPIEVLATQNQSMFPADVDVTALDERPAGTSHIQKRVYSYFRIEAANKTSQPSISTIRFTVPKKWLLDNKIRKEEVALKRYIDKLGRWEQLKTRIASETPEEVVFEAETPGFSYFAIAAETDSAQLPEPVISKIDNPYKITGLIYDRDRNPLSTAYTIKNLNTNNVYKGRSISGMYYALAYGNKSDTILFSSGLSQYRFDLQKEPGSELQMHFMVERPGYLQSYLQKYAAVTGAALLLIAGIAGIAGIRMMRSRGGKNEKRKRKTGR